MKTKKSIQQSFLKIALSKPVDRITVKEIVEDCQVNRNSFYYHFEDMPDLIAKTLLEIISKETKLPHQSVNDTILTVLKNIETHKELVYRVYVSGYRQLIEQRMFPHMDEGIRKALENGVFERYPFLTKADEEILIRAYKNLLIGYLLDWMHSGMKYSLTEEFERIWALRQESVKRRLIDQVKTS